MTSNRPDHDPARPADVRILALADETDLLDGSFINEAALRAILRIALTDLLAMTPAEAEALDLSDAYRLILADDCARLIRATGAPS